MCVGGVLTRTEGLRTEGVVLYIGLHALKPTEAFGLTFIHWCYLHDGKSNVFN